ncbi:expressed protein [Chlorella variabilis]|uniref:Expressed protein n=1 Tax=Chlorella variabilis TaxID=554065 RepID=E1ZJI7_CHLVA|nr:expressed protein [Chlorella variabilis]EFN53998.1 expressed protein [Chlorella variabilis]|eukprot:XP_005846100.1 expressed protein [Chlorella variabilis]
MATTTTIRTLVKRLCSGGGRKATAAARTLADLSYGIDNRTAIIAAGGIPALVRCLGSKDSSEALQQEAAAVLCNLSSGSPDNKAAIAAAGAIPALVQHLRSSSEQMQEPLRSSGSEEVQARAADLLGMLASDSADNQAAIAAAGAIPALVRHLRSSSNAPQQSQSCVGDAGCMYQRPPAQPQLHLDHPRLARPASAGPHTPEQASYPLAVHLAFAGPGGYAVTWLTHPMDEAGLAAAAEEAVDEADAAAAAAGGGAVADGPAAGGEEPYLAAAGPQPHLEAQKAAAAAEANADAATGEEGEEEGGDKGSEAGAANRKKHKKKKKHRRKRRRCSHVVAAGGRSVVQYGMQPGDYPFTGKRLGSAGGALRVESREPVACYSSGAYVSGAIHRVKIGVGTEGPLPPNTTVYYRCGDPERGWSQEFSFVTAPLVGVAALPYRLGLIGDLGQTDHSMSTLDHVTVTDPASIILTGDLSYADGYQPRCRAGC